MGLLPTRSAILWIAKNELTWGEVYEDLASPETVTPHRGSDTRLIARGSRFVGYVEPLEDNDELLVGLRLRERLSPALATNVVGIEPRAVRSSRRGGSGSRWPRSFQELHDRLTRLPDVTVERGGGHLLVKKDGHFVDSISLTASDWRALPNACSQLRRRGLDVRV